MNTMLSYAARSAFSLAVALTLSAEARAAQGAHHGHDLAPVVAQHSQPPRLVAEAPLAEPLKRGVVVIPYRTENFRIVPAFGVAARDTFSLIGHLHVTVDGAPWHWADTSGLPLIVAGLPAGKHSVLIELADPSHKVIDSQTVSFEVPQAGAGH